MVVKRIDNGKSLTGRAHEKERDKPQETGKIINSSDQKHRAIKSLLSNTSNSIDDKLATLKTAQRVDKDRFQSAFRRLMRTTNS